MDFNEIARDWKSISTDPRNSYPASVYVKDDKPKLLANFLWGLFSPEQRGWFLACNAWLYQRDEGSSPDSREIKELLNSIDPHLKSTAECYLEITSAMRRNWASYSLAEKDLEAIAGRYCPPMSQILDLVAELKTSPTAMPRPPAAGSGTAILQGTLEQHEKEQSISLLLIENGGPGVVATLHLEFVARKDKEGSMADIPVSGESTLYAVPAMMFVQLDDDFENTAKTAFKSAQKLCPMPSNNWDVRWWLQRRDGHPLPQRLKGNSAGGAFAIALAKLLAESRDVLDLHK